MNKDKDKDLRLRVQALAGVSPQDFGVDDYLLLNKEAPMMKMVKTQSDDFVRMSQQMMRKSVLRSSTQTNPKNFLPKFSSVYKSRDSTLSSDSTVFEKADDSRGSLSAEVILEDEDEYLHRQSTANGGRRNTEGTQRGPSMVIRTSDSIVDDAEQFQEENKVNSHDSNPASLNDTIDVGVRQVSQVTNENGFEESTLLEESTVLEAETDEEKAFISKYFQTQGKDQKSVVSVAELKSRQQRLTSIAQAQKRLEKVPYAEPIKHLRKISSIIAPAEKLECLRDVCKKVDENVLEFWEGVAVKTEKLQLSAD